MPDEPPDIELATLPLRHPAVGEALLDLFGAQTVLRLGLDPVKLEEGAFWREVTIDHVCHPPPGREPGMASVTVRKISWAGLPQYSEDYLIRVSRTINEHDITEQAAIGVMAL